MSSISRFFFFCYLSLGFVNVVGEGISGVCDYATMLRVGSDRGEWIFQSSLAMAYVLYLWTDLGFGKISRRCRLRQNVIFCDISKSCGSII
ncbi:hypothetical protein BDZ97DRAFT_1165624 [Flammula alnicola]|nr:hypothetical protein BDZ97DRAFT_1165624 [Flammula alnicola]